MSEALAVEHVLARAGEQEKKHDWLGAAESFKKALSLVSENNAAKLGELHEKAGYAFFLAGLQAKNFDEFRERTRRAIEEYAMGKESYGKRDGAGQTARNVRCAAMIAWLDFWLVGSVAEKKKFLGECWRLAKASLTKFEDEGDIFQYAWTYNELAQSGFLSTFLEETFLAMEITLKEMLEFGERAIRLLSTSSFQEELSRSLVIVSGVLEFYGYSFLQDPEEQDKYSQKARAYWTKASSVSEETAIATASYWTGGGLGPGSEEAVTLYRRVLESAEKTSDHLSIGSALEILAFHVFWRTVGIEDPDEAGSLLEETVKNALDAKSHFAAIGFKSPGTPTTWSEAPYSDYYSQIVRFETDPLEKSRLLQKSLDSANERLELAKSTGYAFTIGMAHHILSKALAASAKVETRNDAKRSLLESALEHRNEAIRLSELLAPFAYWDLGVYQNYLADIQFELAQLEERAEDRKRVLRGALLTKQNCLNSCAKVAQWVERTGSKAPLAWLGGRQFECGCLWESSYSLTREYVDLREATQVFELAAGSFQKASLPTRLAECWWKAAQARDTLGEHLRASEDFSRASENFKISVEKFPQLSELYTEHSSYMEAWSEIEKARHHHGREEYALAKGCYEKAANLHEATNRWKYLASNYSAWAQVENAEDLSRREQIDEAIEAFNEASRLFLESKKSLLARLERIEDPEERQFATRLARAADQRERYCSARTILEKGRLLEKKGDHSSSGENYLRASEAFERIGSNVESESTRRELKLIASLSKAWRMMAKAEDEALPELYLEASKLFEEAKELSQSEKGRSLALGHSRFCRALEAGTRFTDTGDSSLHAAAVQQLEIASKYYLKADFKTGAEYAKATQLLFDAYAHTDRAKREEDPEKKTKLYMMSVKELQAAAESYLKAEQPAKREQVLKLLDKVEEERMLAASLTEVLHSSPIISSTAAFAAPASTREAAVGLDVFEHANVQASVITGQRDLNIGEDLSLEIELVNAGRGTAQLMRVEEVVPRGFELAERPVPYRIEDHHLNLKGKRLDPLKTEEVKLLLRPKIRGSFILRPRVLYLDENGKSKSEEAEPVQVTVKELGISGWIKGRQ